MTAELLIVAMVGLALGLLAGAVAFLLWRTTAVRDLRRDAIRRSAAVIAGQIQERLLPHLPGFEYDPRDARFIGSPVDYLVFDGLSKGSVGKVVFLEIKTGTSTLSDREALVRDAIRNRRVEWRELHLARDP